MTESISAKQRQRWPYPLPTAHGGLVANCSRSAVEVNIAGVRSLTPRPAAARRRFTTSVDESSE